MRATFSGSSASLTRPYLRPSDEHISSRTYHQLSAMQPWQSLSPNPYPVIPPPVTQKVWILDCRTCGTFLTNRGMKAVLLLRPSVALYSSDALPINCSAYTYNPEALRAPSCHTSSRTSVPRTCECLTQTLCCHGCGAVVGYMIVIPCSRCTASISTTNRATNGHRFVFHSGEIIGTERHYVQDEPGVIPYSHHVSPNALPRFNPHYQSSPAFRHHAPTYLPTSPLLTTLAATTSPVNDSYSFPEQATSTDSSHPRALRTQANDYSPISHTLSRPMSRGSDHSDESVPPPLVSPYPYGLPADHTATHPPDPLEPGDVLYWHHLAKHGEIPGVQEVATARQGTMSAVKELVHEH